MRPVVLSIAGLDPGGGAGIVADIRAIEARGCWAAAVVTTSTVQTVGRFDATHDVPPHVIAAQIEAVFEDHSVAAIKVGLLARSGAIEAVANALQGRELPVVLDPVCSSTSGARFLDDSARDCLRRVLLPLVDVVTPNREEALWLAGHPVAGETSAAAAALLEDGARHVLVTGAAVENGAYEDHLFSRHGLQKVRHRAVDTNRVHGTGCLHSAGLAAELARGADVEEAARRAARWMERALEQAVGFGGGGSPDAALSVEPRG